VDFARVRAVLSGELPFVQSDVDDEVDLRLPDVENPAQDRLLPTPQVDLTRYPAH
jgi:aerobic C4-dicarboxylate transport protein